MNVEDNDLENLPEITSIEPYPFPDFELLIDKIRQDHFDISSVNCLLRKDFGQQNYRLKYLQTLKIDEINQLTKETLLLVYLVNYFRTKKTLIKQSELKVSQIYVNIFSKITQPKDEMINFLFFVVSFLIHRMLFELVPQMKKMINQRLVYDIHHILIFKLNGILISDEFIRNQIDLYFNSKYFDYQLSSFELQIKKKQNLKKNLQEKLFLGNQLHFPKINSIEGGEQFGKQLHEVLNYRKKPEPVAIKNDDVRAEREIESMREHKLDTNEEELHINLNGISPSVGIVLELPTQQIQQEKTKMTQHRVQSEKNREGVIYDQLSKLKQFRFDQMENMQNKQVQKHKKKKLLDVYKLAMPPLEYFQKHPQLDHLFNPMLQLSYVLNNHQESMFELSCAKQIREYMENEEKIKLLNDLNHPKARIQEHLQQKSEDLEKKRSKSDVKMTSLQKEILLGQKFTSLTKEPQVIADEPDQSIFLSQLTSRRQSQLKKDFAVVQIQQKEQQKKDIEAWRYGYRYEDKRKMYSDQFNEVVKNISTEARINHLVQNLQMKQNMFTRALGKKIHKI